MDEPRLKFRYALIPALSVACFLLGLVTSLREPSPTLAIDEVVAMKPVEGEEQMFAEIPIEAVYGVPSKRTERLWTLPKP
ncbi:MAG: hypothetical protein EBS90_10740 [Betaproteobacteria bacterium]|nr:hypothetical protein [Betaproteobacteria bacterium]